MAQARSAGHELLVRIHAVALNPVDYKIREAGAWGKVQPPAILGYDAAGVVEAVVGIGGNLIRKDLIQTGDYAAISARVSQVLGWIREARKK